jgi:predicted acyl esterase
MIGPAAGIGRQNEVESRQDVLVYTRPFLDQDVEVTGPVSLILYVSMSAPNIDFTAKVVDVHPDGSRLQRFGRYTSAFLSGHTRPISDRRCPSDSNRALANEPWCSSKDIE